LNCEFCGSNIRGEPQAVNLDGGVFKVCNSCARLGTPARVPGARSQRGQRPGGGPFGSSPTRYGFGSRPPTNANPPPPKPSGPSPSFSYDEQEMELRTDFAKVIKNAREMLDLSQEEVGRKINEKPSVISHLETGAMKPDDALARKLEHFLKIQLFVPLEDSEGEQSTA
jgi:putative transcription factor